MKIVPSAVDQKLLLLLMILVGVGLVLVFSASSAACLENYQDKFWLVKKQLRGVLIGVIAMVTFVSMDYRRFRSLALPGLLVTFGLLLLVLVPGVGRTVNGATRWIVLWGTIQIQPAEVAKLAVILFLADTLATNYKKRASFKDHLLPNLVLICAVAALVVKQRSLSSATLIGSTGLLMLIVAHANLGHIISTCMIGVTTVGLLIYAEPYRIRRLVSFADPWADPNGAGYQLIQSLMAMGSGGLFGVGIGQGLQKLKHLPFVSTDFIFAVVGEETGLLGSLVISGLFVGLMFRGVRIALRAPDLFGMYLAFGISAALSLQALLNMMVVMGILPTTGIPLPFISYGSSGMVYNLAAAGMLLSVSRATENESMARVGRRWAEG
jgi:cell division protein FtsW